jgi:hypothetical protein
MSETYEVTKDTIKIISTKEEIFDVKKLKEELAKIEISITETEKEPNEILMPNDTKFYELERLNNRKKELNKLLGLK